MVRLIPAMLEGMSSLVLSGAGLGAIVAGGEGPDWKIILTAAGMVAGGLWLAAKLIWKASAERQSVIDKLTLMETSIGQIQKTCRERCEIARDEQSPS